MDIYQEIFEDGGDALPSEFEHMTADDILRRTRLLDNEIRVLKDESTRLSLEQSGLKEKVREQVFCAFVTIMAGIGCESTILPCNMGSCKASVCWWKYRESLS